MKKPPQSHPDRAHTHRSIWKLSVTSTLEAEDAVTDLVERLFGCPACSYHDLESGVVEVNCYFDRRSAWSPKTRVMLEEGLHLVAASGLDIGLGKAACRKVPKEDWAQSWKRHFKPIRLGASLLIKPSWSRCRVRKGQAMVILDPGLSFGTGQHPTTRFCLKQIVAHRPRRPAERVSLLDVGTGSGILAIAAAKLRYAPIHALDYDPVAIQVARDNAHQNHVLDRISLRRADVRELSLRPREPYDLVCANLVADVLVDERSRLLACLQHGGTLVLAGILAVEFDRVMAAFAELDLKFMASEEVGEWRSGSLLRI